MTAPTARVIDAPRPCFLAVRLVHAGEPVPARIWRPCRCTPTGGPEQDEHEHAATCDRFPPLCGWLVGQLPEFGIDAEALWTAGREIEREQWAEMVAAFDIGAPLPLPPAHFWQPATTARLICARMMPDRAENNEHEDAA